jgi:hypothetical protein
MAIGGATQPGQRAASHPRPDKPDAVIIARHRVGGVSAHIGPALAALGYGTKFCGDHEFVADTGQVVDAPVQYARSRENSNGQQTKMATPRQLKFMEAVARETGLSEEDLKEEIQRVYGRQPHELSKRTSIAYIERLQSRRDSVDMAS